MALKSPLEIDKETVKELKIPPEGDVSPMVKLGFLQQQLEELQHQTWRERVNIVHATRLMASDVEALRMKGNNNMIEHKNAVRQFTGGIIQIKQFIDELRKEYPELAVTE